MRRSGNVGNGNQPDAHEPGKGELRSDRVEEVAWHRGTEIRRKAQQPAGVQRPESETGEPR